MEKSVCERDRTDRRADDETKKRETEKIKSILIAFLNKEKEIKAYLDGELLPDTRMKYEIAEEMGLLDRVLSDGWKSLSAKETGRIGGLMTKRKKEKLKK